MEFNQLETEKYIAKLGFEMKAPQRNLMSKVECNVLRDIIIQFAFLVDHLVF